MKSRSNLIRLMLFIGLLFFLSCGKTITNPINTTPTKNSKSSQENPYLILISLDGFRWDYVEKYKPPQLSTFIENGVKAESLIPSYPTKTFPNHYTIATGLYPDRHGILGNNFYSHDKKVTYNIRDREMVEDGSFYHGSPIWIHAAKTGMVTASYYFVGTEANIQGLYPTFYYKFDENVKNEVRVDQAIKWLKMPKEMRPHLITMYFADLDKTGHRFGPNNDEEIKKTLFKLDTILGDLFKGIHETKLPVNIIIVSDHGMLEVPVENYIPIELLENDEMFLTVNNGSIVNIHPKEDNLTDSILQFLRNKEKNFKVYLTGKTPHFEYIPKNINWGAIQVVADDGYYFSDVRSIGLRKVSARKVFGQHGFDPNLKEMHGIFYANGPAFNKGYISSPIKNIHIYPLMCQILGLEIPTDIDGDIKKIESILKLE